jgi:hypothetical protein
MPLTSAEIGLSFPLGSNPSRMLYKVCIRFFDAEIMSLFFLETVELELGSPKVHQIEFCKGVHFCNGRLLISKSLKDVTGPQKLSNLKSLYEVSEDVAALQLQLDRLRQTRTGSVGPSTMHGSSKRD